MNRFGHQQTAHRKIFVQRRPVYPDAAPNQPPIAEGLGAGIAELREPLERHTNRSAIFEMDDKLAFEDFHSEGSG